MTKCYIYTRVSTAIQVDGYSLDAQKDRLRKYADFQNMTIAGEYSDEGKSGKNVDGRPEFLQMLLGLPKPTDTEIYNKMTPFFSIFFDNGFSSEHYGTELHVCEGTSCENHIAL